MDKRNCELLTNCAEMLSEILLMCACVFMRIQDDLHKKLVDQKDSDFFRQMTHMRCVSTKNRTTIFFPQTAIVLILSSIVCVCAFCVYIHIV